MQVHVAYQTSGCIAVRDHDALRHLDFVERLASITGSSAAEARSMHAEIKSFVSSKQPGEVCGCLPSVQCGQCNCGLLASLATGRFHLRQLH